jgi:hypothetical protein
MTGRNLELSRRNHFVRRLDAGRTAAHQLRGAQARDDGELERTGSRGTSNHRTPLNPT